MSCRSPLTPSALLALRMFALCAGIAGLVPVAAATTYVATPIPSLGGTSTYPTGINASGAVVGWSYRSGLTTPQGFVYANGSSTNLGTLGGAQTYAQAINDSGDIAGVSNPTGSNVLHAMRIVDGKMTDLHPAAGISSMASAINSSGDVAGGYADVRGNERAFAIAGGIFVDLGTLGGATSSANAINARRDIVGTSATSGGVTHAFRYAGSLMEDLGTLGGATSVAQGINAGGDVVGQAALAGNSLQHAFLLPYPAGAMQDLGTLGGAHSAALAINSAQHVVGSALDPNGDSRAFVHADGVMHDLNVLVPSGLSGAKLTGAVAINDAGQIAARACVGQICKAFRLDPIPLPNVLAVEYYYPPFDHYFITTIPDEIAKLDNGTFGPWQRTGATIAVRAGPQAGTGPVCRFFSTAFAPKSSHFYTPYANECALVRRNADWLFEGVVFYVATPDDSGTCPDGTPPVYRLYNNGQGGAPNHRYTTSLDVRAQMIARGWVPEGSGPQAVGMCAAG